MSFFQSIVLGIVQGLTEFLPISSSAHMVLVPSLLGWSFPEEQVFPFGVLVQLGTLLAVIVYFRKDLFKIVRDVLTGLKDRKPFASEGARLGWLLVLASIPAVLAGLLIKDAVESVFQSPVATSLFLFVTASMLVAAERIGKRSRGMSEMNMKDALVIGLFQVLALFPGVSRSGSTIAGGMTRDLERPAAGRFSFLMSIPVMLGAGLVSITDLLEVPDLSGFLPVLAAGFIAAAVVGFFSIHWLLRYLVRHPLTVFSVYCVAFGILNLIVAYV